MSTINSARDTKAGARSNASPSGFISSVASWLWISACNTPAYVHLAPRHVLDTHWYSTPAPFIGYFASTARHGSTMMDTGTSPHGFNGRSYASLVGTCLRDLARDWSRCITTGSVSMDTKRSHC